MGWRSQITFSEPALSGKGRFVAFCINLKVADRLDLYVKNMRIKKVRSWPGACAEATDANGRPVGPQPPQISETGRVILLPGFHSTGEAVAYSAAAVPRLATGEHPDQPGGAAHRRRRSVACAQSRREQRVLDRARDLRWWVDPLPGRPHQV